MSLDTEVLAQVISHCERHGKNAGVVLVDVSTSAYCIWQLWKNILPDSIFLIAFATVKPQREPPVHANRVLILTETRVPGATMIHICTFAALLAFSTPIEVPFYIATCCSRSELVAQLGSYGKVAVSVHLNYWDFAADIQIGVVCHDLINQLGAPDLTPELLASLVAMIAERLTLPHPLSLAWISAFHYVPEILTLLFKDQTLEHVPTIDVSQELTVESHTPELADALRAAFFNYWRGSVKSFAKRYHINQREFNAFCNKRDNMNLESCQVILKFLRDENIQLKPNVVSVLGLLQILSSDQLRGAYRRFWEPSNKAFVIKYGVKFRNFRGFLCCDLDHESNPRSRKAIAQLISDTITPP